MALKSHHSLASKVHLKRDTYTENRVNFPIGVYAPHVARCGLVPVGVSCPCMHI